MPKTVCLDFDGVCNTYDGWRGDDELFEPRPGLDVFLSWLTTHDYQVVIHSTRPAANIEMWLWQHGLDQFGIRVTDKKPPAIAYIDDRAIRFDGDFGEAIKALQSFRAHWELPQSNRPAQAAPPKRALRSPSPRKRAAR